MSGTDSKNKRRIIFCDFDGTIARRDVGYHLMTHFSTQDNSDLQELWNTRKIGARECLKIEASRIDASKEEMISYADQFDLDDYFLEFVDRAREDSSKIVVLSDGLDYYIQHLLTKHGLGDLETYANRGVFNGRKLTVEFPYNSGCGVCGSCKGARIREITQRENFSGERVFIGDGYSDLCAIGEVERLFAKSDLKRYCEEEKIDHTPFETFADVSKVLFG